MSELRNCFDRALGIKGVCPENSLYFVACGAALCATETIDFDKVEEQVKNYKDPITLLLIRRFSTMNRSTRSLKRATQKLT